MGDKTMLRKINGPDELTDLEKQAWTAAQKAVAVFGDTQAEIQSNFLNTRESTSVTYVEFHNIRLSGVIPIPLLEQKETDFFERICVTLDYSRMGLKLPATADLWLSGRIRWRCKFLHDGRGTVEVLNLLDQVWKRWSIRSTC